MRPFVLSYPAGWMGLGLLLLRISLATRTVTEALAETPQAALQAILPLLALCLIGGFCSRICSAVLFVVIAVSGYGESFHLRLVGDLTAILALGFAGPGALSLDSVLNGRRTVVIEPSDRGRESERVNQRD